jgi:hypothetical protein
MVLEILTNSPLLLLSQFPIYEDSRQDDLWD